jgi:hypothetical protein
MIIGVKINSFQYNSSLINIINDEFVTEIHLFYDNIKYKSTLINVITSIKVDFKRVYVHINSFSDITFSDIKIFNENECIIVSDLIECEFTNDRYNPVIIPHIDRLLINFNGFYNFFDVLKLYNKFTNYYATRNSYNFNLNVNINTFSNADSYITLIKNIIKNGNNITVAHYIYLNTLSLFNLITKYDDITYILPYNKFYYDLNCDKVIYEDKQFTYDNNLKNIYKTLFYEKEECKVCDGRFFCPKYDVNCSVCKQFYSFFSNFIVEYSKSVGIVGVENDV